MSLRKVKIIALISKHAALWVHHITFTRWTDWVRNKPLPNERSPIVKVLFLNESRPRSLQTSTNTPRGLLVQWPWRQITLFLITYHSDVSYNLVVIDFEKDILVFLWAVQEDQRFFRQKNEGGNIRVTSHMLLQKVWEESKGRALRENFWKSRTGRLTFSSAGLARRSQKRPGLDKISRPQYIKTWFFYLFWYALYDFAKEFFCMPC